MLYKLILKNLWTLTKQQNVNFQQKAYTMYISYVLYIMYNTLKYMFDI